MDFDGENPLERVGESKTDIAVFVVLVAVAGILVFVFLGPRTLDLGVSCEHPIGTAKKIDAFLARLGAEKSGPVTSGDLTTTRYKLKEGARRAIPLDSEITLTTGPGGNLRRVVVKTVYVDPTDQPVLFSKFGRGFEKYWRSIARKPRVFKPVDTSDSSLLFSDFENGRARGLWIKSPRAKTETITIKLAGSVAGSR